MIEHETQQIATSPQQLWNGLESSHIVWVARMHRFCSSDRSVLGDVRGHRMASVAIAFEMDRRWMPRLIGLFGFGGSESPAIMAADGGCLS